MYITDEEYADLMRMKRQYEKNKASTKRYQAKNKEKLSEYHKKWREMNREHLAEYQRERRRNKTNNKGQQNDN